MCSFYDIRRVLGVQNYQFSKNIRSQQKLAAGPGANPRKIYQNDHKQGPESEWNRVLQNSERLWFLGCERLPHEVGLPLPDKSSQQNIDKTPRTLPLRRTLNQSLNRSKKNKIFCSRQRRYIHGHRVQLKRVDRDAIHDPQRSRQSQLAIPGSTRLHTISFRQMIVLHPKKELFL